MSYGRNAGAWAAKIGKRDGKIRDLSREFGRTGNSSMTDSDVESSKDIEVTSADQCSGCGAPLPLRAPSDGEAPGQVNQIN